MAIGDQIKRLVYRIDADASGVERGMDRADEAVQTRLDLIRRQKAIIRIQGDLSALDKDLREARLQLKRLETDKKSIPVDLDTSSLDREIMLTKAKVADLGRQKAEIKVDLDEQGRAYQSARRLTSQMGSLNKEVDETTNLFETWGKRITGTRVNLGPFTTNLRTLAGVLVVMGPIISSLIGSVVALAGSLAQAAAGGITVAAAGFAGLALSAAGAFFAIKPLATSFKEVSTAQLALKTAQDKYGKSSTEAKNAAKQLDKVMAAQPPHIQEVETRWMALKDAFQSRTSGIRTDAVSVINDALQTAQKLLPAFARESTKTFHVAAAGVHDWLEGLRSPEAQHILTTIMGNFRQALPAILHGLGQFATAFARITSSASDFLPEFTRGFDKVATDFADSTANGVKLHRTLGGLVDQTHAWFGLLGATGRLLVTILSGGAGSGQQMIEDFTKTLNEWNRALQTTAGQRNMHDFFDTSVQTTEQFVGVLRRAITLLFALSRATQPFAAGALDVANAVGDIVDSLARLAPLRAIMVGIGAALATAFVAGKIIAFVEAVRNIPRAVRAAVVAIRAGELAVSPFITVLSVAVGALAALAVGFHSSARAENTFEASQREAASATRKATTAIRDQHQALQDLKQGHLDAAQAHIDVRNAQIEETRTQRVLTRTTEKYGADSHQAKQAALEHRQAVISLKQAQKDENDTLKHNHRLQQRVSGDQEAGAAAAEDAVLANASARKELQKGIREDRRKIDALTDSTGAFHGTVQGATMLKNAQADLRDKQSQLVDVTSALKDKQHELRDTLNKLGIKGKDVKRIMDDYRFSEQHAGHEGGQLQGQLGHLIRTFVGVGKTSHGAGSLIGDVTNKILSSFGAKKLSFSLPGLGTLLGGLAGTFQSGGFVVPGSGDGDKYRTAVPSGTFIMNRRASAAYGFQNGGMMPVALEPGETAIYPQAAGQMGYGLLEALNASVPRFAVGGTAGMKPNAAALASQFVSRFGGAISSGLRAGDTGSFHSQGLAFDWIPGNASAATRYANQIGTQLLEGIHNPAAWGSSVSWDSGAQVSPGFWSGATWADHIDHLHIAVGQKIAAIAAQIKRLSIRGPRGPLRDALQGQADALRSAANRYIRMHMPTQGPEATGSIAGGFQKVWSAVNPDLAKWAGLMGRIVSVESGGDAHAGGPGTSNPTHAGWYQYDASTWAGDAPRGAPGWPEGPYDPAIASAGAGNAIRSDGMAGVEQRWTNWDGVAPHLQAGGIMGMQNGGYVGETGIPGAQHLRLPPSPRGRPRKDFGTGPGSWYDWYGRAIDFYDQRGDTRNDLGNRRGAKGDWLNALGQVRHEEDQVQQIIQHDRRHMHHLLRQMRHLPKRLRKSEPPKNFHFRNRKKGESHSEWQKAKHGAHQTWRQNRRAWESAVKDYKARFKQRRAEVRTELPDLFQQLRVDLPTRYNEIRDKITGQQADIGLEQTASGQERYQALLEFGGNFVPLGFAVGANRNRFGTSGFGFAGGGTGATRTPGVVPGLTPTVPHRATPTPPAGAVSHDNRRTVHVTNNYLRPPEDPHTWSASLRHELGAMG